MNSLQPKLPIFRPSKPRATWGLLESSIENLDWGFDRASRAPTGNDSHHPGWRKRILRTFIFFLSNKKGVGVVWGGEIDTFVQEGRKGEGHSQFREEE